jgi:hypothetical protein
MGIRSGFSSLCAVILLSAAIILSAGIPSHAVGLGVSVYGCFGDGDIDSTRNDWYTDNKIEKKGNAEYSKYGIGLVFETSPFDRRFSFRLNPGVGLGHISKSFVRKEYDHDTGALLSTETIKQNHDVIDYNLNAKFCIKALMRDNFNIWVGPSVVLGKSRDFDKHYNDFYFGGGAAAGVNVGLTDSVYFTAGPSINILYSGNSDIDLVYWDCRVDIGMMMNL